MINRVDWRNKAASSSAPLTLTLNSPSHINSTGFLLQVRFCVVLIQKQGVHKALWSR